MVECVPKANLSFAKSVVPCRELRQDETTTLTDTHEVISPRKPSGHNALIDFEKMHGRADNLMLRITEEGRAQIKNELHLSARTEKLVQSLAQYDVKKDFPYGSQCKSNTARQATAPLVLK